MRTFKILKPMNIEIPYQEDSLPWNAWLDCCVIGNKMLPGELISEEKMLKYNDLQVSYYETSISELLEDGYLTVIESAPDMLEALEQAKLRLECADLKDTTYDVICAAIKKSRGES